VSGDDRTTVAEAIHEAAMIRDAALALADVAKQHVHLLKRLTAITPRREQRGRFRGTAETLSLAAAAAGLTSQDLVYRSGIPAERIAALCQGARPTQEEIDRLRPLVAPSWRP
jgi:hypothetical protein